MGVRRRRLTLVHWLLAATAAFTLLGLFVLTLRSLEPSADIMVNLDVGQQVEKRYELDKEDDAVQQDVVVGMQGEVKSKGCATVEEMGEIFSRSFREESLRARKIIHDHFILNGTSLWLSPLLLLQLLLFSLNLISVPNFLSIRESFF